MTTSFNGAATVRSRNSPLLYLIQFSRIRVPSRERLANPVSRSDLPTVLQALTPSLSQPYHPASAPRHSVADPPLATPSPSRKHRVLPDFSFNDPRQQPRLYLQHTPVTHAVVE